MSVAGIRMKSTPWTSITRGVPPVQHQLVAVGILEEGHVADAGVEDLAVELDTALLELAPRLGHVRHAQRDVRGVRPLERRADVRRIDQVERDVLAELELRPAALGDLLQPERVAVELRRPLHVCDRNGHEVRPLDNQPTEPSIWSW